MKQPQCHTIIFDPKSPDDLSQRTTYFEDHLYLLEISTLLELKTQYSFDYTFQSIDAK